MNTHIKRLAVLSALAVLGATGAQAAVIDGTHVDGSEIILTFVNGNNDSMSLDLGVQRTGFANPGSYTLPSEVLAFIDAAGGAANITYGIMAGQTIWREYITSSPIATYVEDRMLANSARGKWNSTLSLLINGLNGTEIGDPAENLAYGPYLSGTGSPNYIDGVHSTWESGDYQFLNTAPGTDPLYLYSVVFSAANLGFANIQSFNGLMATLDLDLGQLNVAAVPAPPAVWLLGTGALLLVRRGWKKARTAA